MLRSTLIQAGFAPLLLMLGCASPGMNTLEGNRVVHDEHWTAGLNGPHTERPHYVAPAAAYTAYEHATLNAAARTTAVDSNTSFGRTPPPLLSPGDRVRVDLPPKLIFEGVFQTSDSAFTGIFEVSFDGTLQLPYVPAVDAAGSTLSELETRINQTLEANGYFRPGMARLHLSIQEWAPIQVSISGAVFNPGLIAVNARNPEGSGQQLQLQGGSVALNRLLTAALRGAGGVTPNADIASIEIIRGGEIQVADLTGVLNGSQLQDFALVHGDQIRVPGRALPDRRMVRPTAITPPGIRVFISNLIVPAYNNASAAVERHATSLPYGSRLHTAVVSGNCAGGIVSTNSDRYAVLVTTDPVSQRPVTIERKVEQLLHAPNETAYNPFLMPNDSIVCYDSRVTNLRDIGRAIGDILNPFGWFF
ncbi:MAG: polysaccharide export protein [Marinobacter adhaerens]|uniref:Polysaccharide export protein n=1 Tax=Marinobacter adhaerens TaxID=1033846 RepID=A0A844I4X8_9GAMM|nr:polysaccharide export protein [Marinobacter adhaerens]